VRVSLLGNAGVVPYDSDGVYESVSSDASSCDGIVTDGRRHSTTLLDCGTHSYHTHTHTHTHLMTAAVNTST